MWEKERGVAKCCSGLSAVGQCCQKHAGLAGFIG